MNNGMWISFYTELEGLKVLVGTVEVEWSFLKQNRSFYIFFPNPTLNWDINGIKDQ